MMIFAGAARARAAMAAIMAMAALMSPLSVRAGLEAPFDGLAGRWVGEGRLGFKDGKAEPVKCRATYFISEDLQGLKQNIRCASPAGKIEVRSEVKHAGGLLSGFWEEIVYNVTGDITGKVTAAGYRVSVKSTDLTAKMEILVRDGKQIVEIQFHHASLVGLTLILQKG